ncbi:MAG: hydroxymethylglutaryl-CoA lyase [Deltaproteobacteria bacterium]|nr:MAG: hydroxymethylglutaryl-CoA lyase [Deltaproteobacteria bacterium]
METGTPAQAVRIYEVCLRDGLQNEPTHVSTEDKVSIARQLVEAGFKDIEVTSFVRPRWIPQLADASEVLRQLPEADDVRFWALVPNRVGLDRALDAGVRHIATFLSASETHNKKNVNRTVRESLAGLERVIDTAKAEKLKVRSYISTVFGCPYEGEVPVERTVSLAHALIEAGADEIALGDTTGMADPGLVKRIIESLVASGVDLERIAVHFHDTRGTALVNAYAAWQCGIRSFDGSIGGTGGCPYAPGAAGNASTEDLLYMFGQMGLDTGVSLEKAAEVGVFMENVIGRQLPGRFHRFWIGDRAKSSEAATA